MLLNTSSPGKFDLSLCSFILLTFFSSVAGLTTRTLIYLVVKWATICLVLLAQINIHDVVQQYRWVHSKAPLFCSQILKTTPSVSSWWGFGFACPNWPTRYGTAISPSFFLSLDFSAYRSWGRRRWCHNDFAQWVFAMLAIRKLS